MRKALGLALLVVFWTGGLVIRGAAAKEKKPGDTGESRWRGVIVRSNKDASTLTVRKGHIERIIHYDDKTKWTKGTGMIDPGQVKDGDRVICLGKYDEKKEFHATRIDLRAPGAGLFH